MNQLLSAIALLLSVSGNVLINYKKRIGFIVWMMSNTLWIVINLIGLQPNWFQIVMFVTYTILNIFGFINWKRSES